jgi:predicted GIY-YIG superfamily endonuclease
VRIHRSATGEDGIRLPNEMLQDVRLTWAARGLLVDLLSRPDGWHGNVLEISREARKERGDQLGEGRAAIGRLFAELERFGYMSRKRTRDAQGNFMTVLEVYDIPQHADIGPQSKPNNSPKYPRGVYLYRHWDADGRLLYVGIANMPGQRERQHAKSSPWMEFQAEMTVERFETRREAEDAEDAAIANEQPIFNLAGNDTPEARERLTTYLTGRGRLDLLTASSTLREAGIADVRHRLP